MGAQTTKDELKYFLKLHHFLWCSLRFIFFLVFFPVKSILKLHSLLLKASPFQGGTFEFIEKKQDISIVQSNSNRRIAHGLHDQR